jgi:hypothetical protein
MSRRILEKTVVESLLEETRLIILSQCFKSCNIQYDNGVYFIFSINGYNDELLFEMLILFFFSLNQNSCKSSIQLSFLYLVSLYKVYNTYVHVLQYLFYIIGPVLECPLRQSLYKQNDLILSAMCEECNVVL